MSVFLSLFLNLLPLYALIVIGFIAGRFLQVDRQSIGTLAMYIFMPVVMFGFVADLDFKLEYIALPFILYAISTIVALSFLKLGRKIYGDNQANLMSMCASMGNTGYFGLPLALLFFSKELVAIYIFMNLSSLIFEATIGYYIAARGNFDVRTSIIKIIKFPTPYAIALGLACNQSGVELPEIFWTYWTHFKGAYVVCGMMIIGAALSTLDRFVFGVRFVSLTFAGKFVVYPLLAFGFIALDQHILQWFEQDIHNLIMIIAIVPPGANIAAFATKMNLQPEKAASTILLGTVFALFYIPLVVWMMGIGL